MALTHEEYYGSPASRYRSKRFGRFLLPLLKEVRAARGRLRILDVGGTSQYWRPHQAELRTLDAAITLLNLQQMDDIRDENFIRGSATDVPLPDGAFDLVHSNSTIEHVGPWLQMLKVGGRDQASCECLLRTDAKLLVSSGAALQSAVAPFSTGAAARAAGDASTPRFRRNTIRNHVRCYASGPRCKASGPHAACSPLSRG